MSLEPVPLKLALARWDRLLRAAFWLYQEARLVPRGWAN